MTHFAREIKPDDEAWKIVGQTHFHSKVAVDADTCVFAANVYGGEHDFYDPGDPYSLFYRYSRGEWRCVELSARITGISRYRDAGWKYNGVAILSEAGEIWILGDRARQLRVDHPDAFLLSGIHVLDGLLLVTGHGGQVYRQDGDRWVHDDRGMYRAEPPVSRPREGDHGSGRFSCSLVDRTPGNGDLYAAGMAYIARPSLFWRPSGQDWQWHDLTGRHPQLDQIELTGIFAANAEDVWISTNQGVLLRGNGRTGFEIAFEGMRDTGRDLLRFTQPRLFEGHLYTGGSAVCRLSPHGDLEKVARPLESKGMRGPTSSQPVEGTIDVVDGILWAIGDEGLSRFDGTSWEMIPMPSVQ